MSQWKMDHVKLNFQQNVPVSEFQDAMRWMDLAGPGQPFQVGENVLVPFWMMIINPTPKRMVPKLGNQPIKNGWTEPESFYPS